MVLFGGDASGRAETVVNQAQLVALTTILPTLLGVVGVVFLVVAFWPLAGPGARTYVARGILFGLVGAGCVAASVWLWLAVLRTAGQVQVQDNPPPGGSLTTTISGAQSSSPSPSAKPSAAASGSAVPSGPPSPPPNLTPVPIASFQPDSANPRTVIVGVESFERGAMLYRDDVKHIYVLTDDKRFKVYADTWREGVNPDLGSLTPEAGKYKPRRGFGWLWNSNPDVRQALGQALQPEQGFEGQIGGDGTVTTIRAGETTYAFGRDGSWTLR